VTNDPTESALGDTESSGGAVAPASGSAEVRPTRSVSGTAAASAIAKKLNRRRHRICDVLSLLHGTDHIPALIPDNHSATHGFRHRVCGNLRPAVDTRSSLLLEVERQSARAAEPRTTERASGRWRRWRDEEQILCRDYEPRLTIRQCRWNRRGDHRDRSRREEWSSQVRGNQPLERFSVGCSSSGPGAQKLN
jgi:hypothetical protein